MLPGAAPPMKTAPALLALLAAVTALAPGCVAFQNERGVTLATAPPGARVSVNGQDTGYVTPCHLGLPRERQRIDFELDGYLPATLQVVPSKDMSLIYWDEARVTNNTWRFPLWLNAEDGLWPVKLERGLAPRRVFIPLRRPPAAE
jgi:hypothetical protein